MSVKKFNKFFEKPSNGYYSVKHISGYYLKLETIDGTQSIDLVPTNFPIFLSEREALGHLIEAREHFNEEIKESEFEIVKFILQ